MSAASVVIPFPSFVLPERNQPLNFQQMDKAVRAAIKTALDQAHNLTSAAKRIWLYCSGLTSRNGDYVFPHHETIAEKLGISKKTVQRALKNLADSGWLKYEPGAGLRGNKLWLMLPVSLGEQLDKMTSSTGQSAPLNRTNCPVVINSPIEPLFNPTAAPEQPKTSETLFAVASPLCGEKFSQASSTKNSARITTAVETITNPLPPEVPPAPLPHAALVEAVKACAARIHQNHPPQRRIPLSQVEKRLRGILGYQKLTGEPALAYLRELADRHGGWCRCKQWKEQDGRFAKGLGGWLEPKEELYTVDSPEQTSPASPEPRGLSLEEIK